MCSHSQAVPNKPQVIVFLNWISAFILEALLSMLRTVISKGAAFVGEFIENSKEEIVMKENMP